MPDHPWECVDAPGQRVVTLEPLDFEQPIAALEERINQLAHINTADNLDIAKEITYLRDKSRKLTGKIYGALRPWDIVRVARHIQRPYSCDYIQRIFSDFDELHGDRRFGDDHAIIAGIGRFDGAPVAIIGQEKGRATKDKVHRNFGMARPEGYRKAHRVMKLAERFKLPVLTLIDTPGAHPGIDAEERGISEAIAVNLATMSCLATPIICTVIGEGSSGGALGIGVGDHLCMMQFATYFVISPEGCANIIWKTPDKAPEAAEAMGITSTALLELGLVDAVIEEPLGGAHRDPDQAAQNLKAHLLEQLRVVVAMPTEQLLQKRYARLLGNVS